MGNDFYREFGDCFSSFPVLQPDRDSELTLLRKFGPSISDVILNKLLDTFEELRRLVVEGQVAYPYSTRELVALVRHVNSYPNDGISQVLANVFDFDAYDQNRIEILRELLQKLQLPHYDDRTNKAQIRLAPEKTIPSPTLAHSWALGSIEPMAWDFRPFPVRVLMPTQDCFQDI